MLSQLTLTIDRITAALGRGAAWLALVLVLVMVAIVLLRYFFSFGSIAMQESVLYINTLLLTVGIAYALKEQAHVRVDIFYSRFPPRWRARVDLIGSLVLLLPSMGFVLYFSWDYVVAAWRVSESSTEASGLPYVYLLKTCILLLAGLLIMQALAELGKAIGRLRVTEPGPAANSTASTLISPMVSTTGVASVDAAAGTIVNAADIITDTAVNAAANATAGLKADTIVDPQLMPPRASKLIP